MTLTELRYIVAVAQEKHFGRAAQRCYVSQPTLSIAIRKLEEELGLTLFDRSCNEIIMTNSGQQIIVQAQRVLEEADRIKLLANKEKNELEGIFKLGLIFTVAPYLLPKLILSLRTLVPAMCLQLDESYTSVLTDSLKRGDLDAIVVAEPFHETGLETIPLYDEPFFVIVPKGHPFEKFDEVTTQQLSEERVLLLTEGNCMRNNILDSCHELASRQNILGLSNNIQGSSINTISHMVASGLGISIMPATALTESSHLFFSIIPFAQPSPNRRVILVSRRNFARPRALEIIKKAIFDSHLTDVKFIEESK